MAEVASTPAAQADSKPSRTLDVLLAEDNVVNQRLALSLLQRRGHAVTTVSNGREAIEAVERHSFDVVLMDVQMPEMGGPEAPALIRARGRARRGTMSIVVQHE